MKPTPTPRTVCARGDCARESKDKGYCPTHAALIRRRGVPYRRDEQDEMQAGNTIQQQMDQALDEKPPRIRWAPNGKGVQVAIEVDDPHTKRPWRPYHELPLPPENHDGCTCPACCNIHEENR